MICMTAVLGMDLCMNLTVAALVLCHANAPA